jgi:hypothetical protein
VVELEEGGDAGGEADGKGGGTAADPPPPPPHPLLASQASIAVASAKAARRLKAAMLKVTTPSSWSQCTCMQNCFNSSALATLCMCVRVYV